MDSNENCGTNSTLKIIAAYGPLRNISKCHIFLQFWPIAILAEIERGAEFLKIVKFKILQSAPNDPKPNSRNWASKVPSISCTIGPRVPNFPPICYMIIRFRDIPHFRFSH